jgi:putative MATE family efflux protein
MALWRDIREAIAGSQQDYTEGPMRRAILMLAVPMVLEMCMESLFGIVDIFWVARLGAAATAAVGLTESVESLVYGVAMGLAMATSAMVARRTGEKDLPGAAQAAGQGITLALAVSLAVGIPGSIFARQILMVMGAHPDVVATGAGFTRIIQASSPIIMLLFVINAIFRGAGDAAVAMRVLWFANGLNIVLDPICIFGLGPIPAMGVQGAAVATTIGRSAGVCLQLYLLASSRSRIHVLPQHLIPEAVVMGRLVRVSLNGMMQTLIPTASWAMLVRIIAVSGSAALAGYTIAIRIVIFTLLPAWGLSNAAATMVGQNLGAKRPERAEAAVWLTGRYNMAFLGGLGLLFVLFPAPLVSLFTNDPEVSRFAEACLRTISYGYLFYANGMVLVQAFNGAGDTATPTWINLGCYWAFQIPLAWTLAMPLALGAKGAFWAVPAAESLLAAVAILLFRKGRWKLQQI